MWIDFIALRKAKRSPLSKTALDGIEREALKAGLSLDGALAECCARGWVGFKAEWVAATPPQRASPSQTRDEKRAHTIAVLTGKIPNENRPFTSERDITAESHRVA